MQLVIIAGGKGSRLNGGNGILPKPMVDIGGKPLLERQILLARKYGIRDILILTGYGAEHIERYFGNGDAWNVRISFLREPHPLGTAGALLNAFDKLQEIFVLSYGDVMLNVNLSRLLASHPSSASATLLLHPNNHPRDSDIVELNGADQVTNLHFYPHPDGRCFANLVNAALYVFSKKSLTGVWEEWRRNVRPIDVCRDLFPKLLAGGGVLRGYRSREYLHDAGTPDRVQEIRNHYATGRIGRGSFETSLPAVFLDRDGTLNVECGWIHSPDQIKLLPGAGEAIRAINESGRLAVVITNQPVVARGECTESELKKVHDRIEWLLGASGAYLDGFYFCPHHPDSGFSGERPELKRACSCRKPGVALFEAAIWDLNIDRERSWMIGDSLSDVESAARLGIPAALVDCNQQPDRNRQVDQSQQTRARNASEPRLKAASVLDAVQQILAGSDVERSSPGVLGIRRVTREFTPEPS